MLCAIATPPPPYIFRAGRYSDLIPRFEDDVTGELVSSFASETYIQVESDCESEIAVEITSRCEMSHTVSDSVHQVAMQLKKTKINESWASRGEERYLSQFISLSGSFHWAVHITYLKGRTATEGQEAGLAVFDNSEIKASGIPLQHVRDLLTFSQSDSKFDSYRIDRWAREWAMNSGRISLLGFGAEKRIGQILPYERLVYQSDYPNDYFLRSECIGAMSLGDFDKGLSSSLKLLTVD